jgi:hypothetical protein
VVGRDEARGTQRVDVASHPHSKSPRKAEAVREGARQPMERMVTCQLHVSYMSVTRQVHVGYTLPDGAQDERRRRVGCCRAEQVLEGRE